MGTGKTKKQHQIKGDPAKISMIASMGGMKNMSFKDLQRRAIVLGMPFPDVVSSDYFRLESFIRNSMAKPDLTLIDKYDEWMDRQLEERGYGKDDPMRSYQLRLGYVREEDDETKIKRLGRVRGLPSPKKPKREKDEQGLWKGTKKSYTFELTRRGFSLERIIRRVQKKFPEANPKSIKQWHRIALSQKEAGEA